ncbi:hypothetical protein QOZ80_3AG0232710 [Eleusine coracana subsp. coracana]|nr:hypothetical protein QOZ80_3AG0232710 [Eleusine coracana subsp. coracana]
MPSLAARLAFPAATLLVFFAASASATNFTCTARTTCRSAIGYSVPNATTYGDLLTLFNTTTLPDLLGANGLPPTTAASTRIAPETTVVIPFRCRCSGNKYNVGQSDGHPVYVVKPQDGLDAIARNVFGAFITFQEIATANNISDPNLIQVGQKLWIPLPCSCDQVDGADVMHFAYSVAGGDTTSAIAARYGVSENTLLTLNKITKDLQKEQILDVPLPVCHSSISNTSADHGLLIPNGSYALTANNCIQCKCSANTYQLDCTPVQGNRSCPAVPPCTGGLKLGEMNRTGCGSMCAYSGYTNGASLSIQTTLVSNQTACQKGGARRLEFSGSAWTMSVICFHMVLILIWSL